MKRITAFLLCIIIGVLFVGVTLPPIREAWASSISNGFNEVAVQCVNAVGDTAAINAALSLATTKYTVHVIGTCLLNGAAPSLIQITHPVIFKGDGMGRTILSVRSDVTGATDIINVSSASVALQGVQLIDFTIVPASGTPGRNGIFIDTSAHPVYNLDIGRVNISGLGGRAISTLNLLANVDGFFTSTIHDSAFSGGLQFVLAGDSVNIQRNTITGPNAGIEWSSIYVVGVPSNVPKGPTISQNNMTPVGCGIRLITATKAVIEDNNIEIPVATTCATSAVISLEGDIANSYPVSETSITRNYIAGGVGTINDNIRFGYTFNTTVANNLIPRDAAGVAYRITANATWTSILDNETQPVGELPSAWLADLGVQTYMEYRDPSSGIAKVTYYNTHYLTYCFTSGRCTYGSSTDDGVGLLQVNGSLTLGLAHLYGPSANILEQRNGGNAQNYYSYQTYTDASNYERFDFGGGNGSVGVGLYVGTNKLGTGVNRQIVFIIGGNPVWTVSTGGAILPVADNGFNIGSASLRPALVQSVINNSALYQSGTNCSSTASPAVCASALAGSVTIAAAATTVVVNTTAVTANSQIIVLQDAGLQTKLGIGACYSALNTVPWISARTAGTSFTITATAPTVIPACYSYQILN